MRVAVYQPVVPWYRVPFFDALAHRDDVLLTVEASLTFPGSPPTVDGPFDFMVRLKPVHSYLNNRLFWQQGARIPRDFEPGDVIVISGNVRLLSNILLVVLAKARGIGVVWWGHGKSPSEKGWVTMIRRRLMRLADSILLYTAREAEEFRRGWDNPCVFGANNTLDITAIEQEKRRWSVTRLSEFQIRNDISSRKVLLFCSRLNESKGVDVLLHAVAILTKNDPAYLLVIIGDGPDRSRLGCVAKSLQIHEHVRWLGAIYEQARLAPWFLSALAFVYPGPIGLSIMSAFAYGLPVVTHDNPENHGPEFVALQPRINGVTFSQGNCQSLAERIKSVTESEEHRARMGEAAYRTVCEDFSMDTMVNRFVAAARCAVTQVQRRTRQTVKNPKPG